MMPTLSLVPIWTLILAIAVFLYVALDGFDLGVGMLYNFAPDRRARDLVMNSIAPIWDGNETWLILGSVGLLAVFPVAFAIIIPAVYFPVLAMLLALIFRGLAFEFRYSSFDCFTPFSIFIGIALIFGYALLGAGWLVIKTEGVLQTGPERSAGVV